MKILYVLEFLPPYVKREIEVLAEMGHSITVLMPETSSSGTAWLWNRITEPPSGGNVYAFSSIPLRLLNAGFRELTVPALKGLKHLITVASLISGEFRYALAASETASSLPGSYEPDVIHAHFALDAAHIAGKLSKILGAPFTVTTHATDIFVPRRRDRLERILSKAAAVLTISDFNRSYMAEKGIFSGEAVLCKLGVPFSTLPERKPAAKATEGICIASGLAPKKGVGVLLDAMKILKDESSEISVKVIGSDPSGIILKQMREKAAGLPVTFTGALSSVETLEAAASAGFFVLPCVTAPNGDMDGIPVALMEAMAIGIPCISTAVSGVPELVEHRLTGLLAEPGSSKSLAEMMKTIVTDTSLSEKITAAGRKKVRAEHDPQKQAEILTNVFRKVSGK